MIEALIFQPFRRIKLRFAKRRAQREARDAFMQLVCLDDHILADVGYRREDVAWAAKLPLQVDAARALQERTRAISQPGAGAGRFETARSCSGDQPPVSTPAWHLIRPYPATGVRTE